jgi:hypothetical protein
MSSSRFAARILASEACAVCGDPYFRMRTAVTFPLFATLSRSGSHRLRRTVGTPAVAQNMVAIDNDDIGGVVSGLNGPEAGVWVIAETSDLPTRFARMVVTDNQGRYVAPDLPKAKYKVWVLGYGLIDSVNVDCERGKQLDLRAVPAPNDAAAAQYNPAIYWYSMIKIPEANLFDGKGAIPSGITQQEWLTTIKNRACIGCHQIGQLSTRTIPAAFGPFKSGEDAWIRRTQSGQAAELMVAE